MSNKLLLDTNIVSFLFKNDSRIEVYRPYLLNKVFFISMMTVAELLQWTIVQRWGNSKVALLEKTIFEQYSVLPIDIKTCHFWAKVRADCRSQGKPISPQDAWIAATSLQYNLTLVSHNYKDFKYIKGLDLISESFE